VPDGIARQNRTVPWHGAAPRSRREEMIMTGCLVAGPLPYDALALRRR
jgi:hypothetical protein